ncbi:sulfite exporter TauE/SafE family protein [Brevibacillus humidisoli]|uniref:sulfite exporter TauE/SafE family protein n=1 Tax=Brevibacillus humidisoli TaxID=2895522 RepID=UPI001E42985A|nr:sulfite exporter TauE/SafE family protein [Brevibacillus humidisoli]UFJ42532.1 sulfite exporter TauE/SafE family protein [Brevibacillus humidisoli]
MDIWLIISGWCVGIVIGATGMGGGLIMTPLLILGFGVPPKVAVATDLIFASVTKLFGAWQHWRQQTVDYVLLKRVLLGSIPGTLIGIVVLKWLADGHENLPDEFISKTLAIVFFVIVAIMILQSAKKRMGEQLADGTQMKLARVAIIGFVVGFLVAVTSVGSGSLFAALLFLTYPFSAARLVGTDIVHGVLITGLAGLSHFFLGTIDLALAGNLLLGSVPGVLIGSKLGAVLPDRVIRLGLIVMLLVSAVKLW